MLSSRQFLSTFLLEINALQNNHNNSLIDVIKTIYIKENIYFIDRFVANTLCI